MKYLSLFSGIGGFDIAFTRAGMVCVGMCEIDPRCREVLQRNSPDIPIYNDVKEIGVNTHERGSVDLVCGGFPCQDLSIAGKRKGLAGERSGLWFEFARIIDELEPRWVVIENVPGLLSSDKGQDFALIIQWLAQRGYGVSWRVLDAQYFGVPQRRRRVFIVGSLGNGRSAEVLFESEGVSRDTPKGREEGEDIARPIANSTTTNHYDESQQTYIVEQNNVASTPDKISLRANPAQPVISFDANRDGTTNEEELSPPLTHCGEGEKSHGAYQKLSVICISSGQANAEAVKDGEPSLTAKHANHIVFDWQSGGDVRYNLSDMPMLQSSQVPAVWEMSHASEAVRENGDIAPTLQQRMGTGGNQVPLVGVRRLTPTECARLQGFPDNWNDWLSDSTRYRQFGNAVAVPVVEWIGKRIVEANGCPSI